MTDVEIETVDWGAVTAAFEKAALPPPPDLPCWPAEILRLDTALFGSWQPENSVYAFEAAAREAFERGPADGLLIGFDGYGVQSWAAHVVLHRGPLLVGFQTLAGGIYTDQERAADHLEGAWDILAEMVVLIDDPKVQQGWPAERTLVALDTDLGQSRRGWLGLAGTAGAWEAGDWHDDRLAAFSVLMQLQDLAEGKAMQASRE